MIELQPRPSQTLQTGLKEETSQHRLLTDTKAGENFISKNESDIANTIKTTSTEVITRQGMLSNNCPKGKLLTIQDGVSVGMGGIGGVNDDCQETNKLVKSNDRKKEHLAISAELATNKDDVATKITGKEDFLRPLQNFGNKNSDTTETNISQLGDQTVEGHIDLCSVPKGCSAACTETVTLIANCSDS